jgi:hypothetical protein
MIKAVEKGRGRSARIQRERKFSTSISTLRG